MNIPFRHILHRSLHLPVAAGGGFMLALLGMSLAYLHATLFDHRFTFTVLGTCILGLAAGVAVGRWPGKRPTRQKNSGIWLTVAGLAAVIAACIFFVVPMGSAGSFLLVSALATLPYAFWACGLVIWADDQDVPAPRLIPATVLGALAGVIVSFPLAEQSSGPLFTAWLGAMGLVALAMVSRIRIATLAVSGLSAALLGLAGMFNAWDFTAPPRWSSEENSPSKPLYAKTSPEDSMTRLTTRWSDLGRTDIVFDKKTAADLTLVFRNGALSGLLPSGRSEKASPERLRNYFPLVALPLTAARAQNILVINSSAGMELKMAADSGIPRIHGMENNLALRFIVEQRQDLYEHLLNNPGIRLDYGDIRNTLRKDTAEYDQIFLAVPPTKIPGGTEPGVLENYHYTQEAFRDYWARLRPGGMLVVLAGEEMLYMRTLLVAWEILDEDRAGGNALLGSQAWGYRMVTLMPPVRPYHYLLMLVKGPIGDETASRVEQEARGMMVEKLFGPGMLPPATAFSIHDHPYFILYHPKGPAIARKALSEHMSWRLKTRVSLDTPTDRHPDFFQIADDMHPFLKWLVAICSVPLIYIYLFPLGAERRLDNPANNTRPPLPVHLSQYLALGAGAMMALVALASQAVLLTERAGDALTAVMAGALLGAGVAVFYRRRGNVAERQWRVAAPAVVVLSGLLYWILADAREMAGEWPVFTRLVAVAVMTFPLGLFTTQLLLHGLDHLQRNLPALVPWAMTMYGLAAPVGAIAAFWLCQYWGWGVVWAFITGCYLIVLGTSLYLRWTAVHSEMKQVPAQS